MVRFIPALLLAALLLTGCYCGRHYVGDPLTPAPEELEAGCTLTQRDYEYRLAILHDAIDRFGGHVRPCEEGVVVLFLDWSPELHAALNEIEPRHQTYFPYLSYRREFTGDALHWYTLCPDHQRPVVEALYQI